MSLARLIRILKTEIILRDFVIEKRVGYWSRSIDLNLIIATKVETVCCF